MSEQLGTDEPLTEAEEQQLIDLLSHPLIYPQVFKDWISDLTRSQVTPGLPFSDILKSDTLKGTVNLFASIAPSYPQHLVWKDVGTATIPGPCQAVIFFMASSYNWAGDYGHMALSINAAAPDNNERMTLRGVVGRRVLGGRAQYAQLTLPSNTVKLKCMKDGSGDVDFQDICMAVFQIYLPP